MQATTCYECGDRATFVVHYGSAEKHPMATRFACDTCAAVDIEEGERERFPVNAVALASPDPHQGA